MTETESDAKAEAEAQLRENAAQRREEQIEEVGELASTEKWLEQRLDEQSRTIAVMGREFEFRPMGTETAAGVVERIPEGQEEVPLSETPGLLREICELLGEHCKDPALDAEAFGRMPPDVLEGVFMDITMPESDLSPEEQERIEQFRGE